MMLLGIQKKQAEDILELSGYEIIYEYANSSIENDYIIGTQYNDEEHTVVVTVSKGLAQLQDGMCEVPDLSRLSFKDALDQCSEAGLYLHINGRVNYTDYKGKIFSQSIDAGTRVKKGSVIDVVVNMDTYIYVIDNSKVESEKNETNEEETSKNVLLETAPEQIETTGANNETVISQTEAIDGGIKNDNTNSSPKNKCGDNLFYSYDENTCTLTISGSGAMYDYEAYDGSDYSGAPWSTYYNMTTVIIESGITRIGNYAFNNCFADNSLIIPNTVTAIGSSAFAGSEFSSIKLSDNLITIGDSAFAALLNVSELKFPDSIEVIGSYAIENNWKITEIDLANTKIKKINSGLFQACYSLKGVKLPNTLVMIEYNAFVDCQALKEVYLSNSTLTDQLYLPEGCTLLYY